MFQNHWWNFGAKTWPWLLLPDTTTASCNREEILWLCLVCWEWTCIHWTNFQGWVCNCWHHKISYFFLDQGDCSWNIWNACSQKFTSSHFTQWNWRCGLKWHYFVRVFGSCQQSECQCYSSANRLKGQLIIIWKQFDCREERSTR